MIARKRRNVKMEFYTCIAKYTFFGIRDEKLLASARKSWYHTMVCSGIEAVITGLTRNFWKLRLFRPLKMSTAQGFARVRISQFHIVLACFSCILPEQGLHLRYTESCPRGRRCDTRNHVSTLEVQTAEKPVTMRVCGQVQIVNWGLFYPVVLPDFHGLNFAGKWL